MGRGPNGFETTVVASTAITAEESIERIALVYLALATSEMLYLKKYL